MIPHDHCLGTISIQGGITPIDAENLRASSLGFFCFTMNCMRNYKRKIVFIELVPH